VLAAQGSNFQLVKGPLIEFKGIFKQKEQTFVKSSVGFEVAHSSVLMVQRLPRLRFLP